MIKETSRIFSSFLLGIIICFYCTSTSIAQTSRNNDPAFWTDDIQFDIATNQTFFKTYDSINSILIGYKDLKPYYILLNFKNDSLGEKTEHFDLTFEGDLWLLKKAYPSIKVLDLESDVFNSGASLGIEKIQRIKSITIERNKLQLSLFNANISSATRDYLIENIWARPATYVGGTKELEKILSSINSPKLSKNDVDSVFLFKIKISKKGALEEVEPVYGNNSSYSKVLQKKLSEKNTNYLGDGTSKWKAAMRVNVSRPMNSILKIYVKRSQNGQITIKIPTVLRNWTGN